MAEPHSMNSKTNQSKETVFLSEEEVEQLKQCLPKVNFMGSNKLQLINIQGFWYHLGKIVTHFGCQSKGPPSNPKPFGFQ